MVMKFSVEKRSAVTDVVWLGLAFYFAVLNSMQFYQQLVTIT